MKIVGESRSGVHPGLTALISASDRKAFAQVDGVIHATGPRRERGPGRDSDTDRWAPMVTTGREPYGGVPSATI